MGGNSKKKKNELHKTFAAPQICDECWERSRATYTTLSGWAGRPCRRSPWSSPLSCPEGETRSCPCRASYCPGRGNSSHSTLAVSAAPFLPGGCAPRWACVPASRRSWTAPWCGGTRCLRTKSRYEPAGSSSSWPWGMRRLGGPAAGCVAPVGGGRPRAETLVGSASGSC